MKKTILTTTLIIFTIFFLNSCGSSRHTCDAYSDNDTEHVDESENDLSSN